MAVLTCYTWYRTGGDDEGFRYYRDRIAEVSGRYEKVLMLGDSMGEPHQAGTSFVDIEWVIPASLHGHCTDRVNLVPELGSYQLHAALAISALR